MGAVARSGNTVHVTAAGDVYSAINASVKIIGVIISPAAHGSGSPILTIVDQSPSPNIKLKIATANTTTTPIDFSNTPIECFGGFSVSALSGAVATIILGG